MIQAIYNESHDQVLERLNCNSTTGLSSTEVAQRLQQYGFNTFSEKKKPSLFIKILNQFKDILVLILIAATIVSGLLGELVDAAVILAIVIINAVLGVIQEGRAEKAIEALMKMTSPQAKVIRDGKQQIVDASLLVPGDLVVLDTGDIVPADLRLLESILLKLEEASLTGESLPVDKNAEMVLSGKVPLGDQRNMAFMSTSITSGRGRGIVVRTGNRTIIGSIADQLQNIEEEATPLKKNLNKLGKILGIICLVICAIVFVEGILMGGELLAMFMTAVSLAVAAIPEGLPAVVTIVLALGMKSMANRNSVVKRLLAVETLGSVDVICSDKTGTLTQNEMTVTDIYLPGKMIGVEERSSSNKFGFTNRSTGQPETDSRLYHLLTIGSLCNEAILLEDEDANTSILGDPTEGALVMAAHKAGLTQSNLKDKHKRVGELPFDSARKMMTTVNCGFKEASFFSLTKGAPDIILNRCNRYLSEESIISLDSEMKASILEANKRMSANALRVLAVAYKPHTKIDLSDTENDMIFTGLIGMIDPPRPEAREAIRVCKEAGIRAVMITGDYRGTAMAIADDLGLRIPGTNVLDGADLDDYSDEELKLAVENTSVYARVSPDHKVRIVSALKKNNHIVSMTGDGVNDALALKTADIGVAMGITGTDVAKSSADMILTDDNFASIVSAVHEGRIIYNNIRKFVGYLLSCNVAEILVIFVITLVMGSHFVPLLPIQLLWLNLLTDSFPALALGQEKGEPNIMNQKPRSQKEPILNKLMIRIIIIQSIAIFAQTFVAFLLGLSAYPSVGAGASTGARTYAFGALILSELFRSYSARSENLSVFKLGFFKNAMLNKSFLLCIGLLMVVIYVPFLNPVFSTIPLKLTDWIKILPLSLIPFFAAEIDKVVRIKKWRKNANGDRKQE